MPTLLTFQGAQATQASPSQRTQADAVAPPAPGAPQAPLAPSTTTGATTVQEVQGLRARLELLRSELQDAASRRRTISGQLRSTDSKAVPGLERRMAELDDRIIGLEREITNTGLRLTSTSPELLSQAAETSFGRGDLDPNQLANNIVDEIVPIVAIISIFVLAPIGLAISRLVWKRGSVPRRAPVDTVTQQRLEGLQQSVDTIAIEVERISEGQRFVTKLLSDRDRVMIGEARK